MESTGLGKTLFKMLLREGLPEYKDELVAFDKGIHNDQVDVISYVARCLVKTFAEDESGPFIIRI